MRRAAVSSAIRTRERTTFGPGSSYPTDNSADYRYLCYQHLLMDLLLSSTACGDYTKKKDKDRREGKSRRCYLGGRIYSIPCLAIAILHHDDFKNRMNCTWLIWRIWWNHPFLQIILAIVAFYWINSIPQPAATTFAFPSVWFLFYGWYKSTSYGSAGLVRMPGQKDVSFPK